MRLLLNIILPLLLSGAGAPQDSLFLARLDSMLLRYTEAIAPESIAVKNAESDFLIGSVSDSLTTQHIALWLYEHYSESPVMGEEAVAVHLWDKWFQPGTIQMRSKSERFDAELFASFNRATLLGMKAPVVNMLGPCGKKMQIPQEGRYSILFFYDTSCAKCQLEAKMLPQVLERISFPATFYAVYCGADKKAWSKFRCSFKPRNRNLNIVHCWDPEIESDYLRLYGVISTPRIFFTDTDGEIIGRRLEIESLNEIISYICVYYEQAQKQ